jgi:hypothetical protein
MWGTFAALRREIHFDEVSFGAKTLVLMELGDLGLFRDLFSDLFQ